MKIEIFGQGCTKCKKTYQLIKDQLAKEGLEAEVIHITDLKELIARGILMTPAVMLDGELKLEGRLPKAAEIDSWF